MKSNHWIQAVLSAVLAGVLAGGAMGTLADEIPVATEEGYAVPQPNHVLSFPRSHGSHPDFKIEWWYITGHLDAEDGDRYGFQLTFFRSALRPPEDQVQKPSMFGRDHLYMAHSAWIDAEKGEFTSEERLARNGWDAVASTNGLDLRNGNWTLAALSNDANPDMQAVFTVRDKMLADLTLTPAKPFVRFGEQGVEQKGAKPSEASYYITWTRLDVSGEIDLEGERVEVSGQAWMDHEISSSQLGEDQVGWDWASIQLKDGREIMMYLLRRSDGSLDPYSVLYWIDADGETTSVGPDEFVWKGVRTWTSPVSGGQYPVEFELQVVDPASNQPIVVRLRSLMDDQEHDGQLGGIPYWEGACDVWIGDQLRGRAFVELTGYSGSLNSALR